MRLAVFVGLGLVVALALAFFVSPQASDEPDGLNRVAIDEGFADREEAHDMEGSPLAGYGVEGVDDDRLGTGLSGVIGVTVTFAIVGGGFLALRRLRRRRDPSASADTGTGAARPEPT
jgi:PDGLE domain-containing protein